jgi:hypothetical protein
MNNVTDEESPIVEQRNSRSGCRCVIDDAMRRFFGRPRSATS